MKVSQGPSGLKELGGSLLEGTLRVDEGKRHLEVKEKVSLIAGEGVVDTNRLQRPDRLVLPCGDWLL